MVQCPLAKSQRPGERQRITAASALFAPLQIEDLAPDKNRFRLSRHRREERPDGPAPDDGIRVDHQKQRPKGARRSAIDCGPKPRIVAQPDKTGLLRARNETVDPRLGFRRVAIIHEDDLGDVRI